MLKSNIFVYIEISKLIANLTLDELTSKKQLQSQAGYFNVLPIKYFSDALAPEWDAISEDIRRAGPIMDGEGRMIRNAIANTIDQMTPSECVKITRRIMALFEKLEQEFK